MNQKEFIKQYSEQIDAVVNQDAVKAETLHRELDNGQMQGLIDDSIKMGAYAYQSALKQGFDEGKAFTIAMHQIGYDYHE